MKSLKTRFAVTAKHFSLYEAFKKECERLGWTYNTSFTEFSEKASYSYMDLNCLYFSFDFDGMEQKPAFALSSTDEFAYKLETQFEEALKCAKTAIEEYNTLRKVKLTEDHRKAILEAVSFYKKQHRHNFDTKTNSYIENKFMDDLQTLAQYDMFVEMPSFKIQELKLTKHVID
jgi:hypothetical protein